MRYTLVGLVLLAACTSGPARPPTAAQAERFLTEVVQVAQTRNFDALCDMGGGSCSDFVQERGGQNVPEAAPRIVGGRMIEPTGNGGAGRVGGYVLEMCGTNAAGETYYSEMLVFFDINGEIRGIEPVYWMGIRISETNEVGLHLSEKPPAKCEPTT